MRAAHAGQALDIKGVKHLIPEVWDLEKSSSENMFLETILEIFNKGKVPLPDKLFSVKISLLF